MLSPVFRIFVTGSMIFHSIYLCWCMGQDQPGKVANPARGQLNWANEYFPVPIRA